jgi:hypothetical protein
MLVGMKFQFSIKAIFLATTFIAIALGGLYGWHAMMRRAVEPKGGTVMPISLESVWIDLRWGSPFWLPLAFLGYAVGRRTLTVSILIAFALSEAIAIGITAWWPPL